jgi:hypothetical protein
VNLLNNKQTETENNKIFASDSIMKIKNIFQRNFIDCLIPVLWRRNPRRQLHPGVFEERTSYRRSLRHIKDNNVDRRSMFRFPPDKIHIKVQKLFDGQ